MHYQVTEAEALRLIADPNTPWGKVLGYSWSTDRWVDNYPISFWESLKRFAAGRGWHRTEDHHLLRPGEPGYNPIPYRVTHIL